MPGVAGSLEKRRSYFKLITGSFLAWSLLMCVVASTSVFHLSNFSLKTNEEPCIEMALELAPLPDFAEIFHRLDFGLSSISTELTVHILKVLIPSSCQYIVGYSTTDLSPPKV